MRTRPARTLLVACAAVLTATTACGSGGADRSDDPPAAAGTHRATVRVPSGMGAAPFGVKRTVTIPRGWTMSVFARVDAPRLAVWTPDRRLLVSRPEHGDVVLLTPRGGKAPSKTSIVRGLRQPHGLAFLGSRLYVAESNRIDTYTYRAGRVGKRHTLVSGLPDAKSPELGGQYAHALKSVAVRKDGRVYISVGSTDNISAEDRSARPQRATILRYWKGKLTVTARGVRNGTGLAIDPAGYLWTAVNNRDQIADPSDGRVKQSYVNNHPMEEFARLTRAGRDLGWPYCNPNPDVAKNDYAKRPFQRDVQTNRNGKKLTCGKLTRIEQGFPAHSAPLGLSFTTLPTYGRVALVATHGSWNRTPPRAPTVTYFRWKNGQVGAGHALVAGFQNSDGSRWGRPVAAVRDPKSSAVYITDDAANAIYKLTPG